MAALMDLKMTEPRRRKLGGQLFSICRISIGTVSTEAGVAGKSLARKRARNWLKSKPYGFCHCGHPPAARFQYPRQFAKLGVPVGKQRDTKDRTGAIEAGVGQIERLPAHAAAVIGKSPIRRSEEHTSELQS